MDEYQLGQNVVKFEPGHSYRAADAERRLTPCYSDQHVRPRCQTFPFPVLYVPGIKLLLSPISSLPWDI